MITVSTTATTARTSGAKVLVYSEAGAGKTSLCATAPSPLIISAESGLLSLTKKNIERMYGVDTPGITYDIPVIEINTMQDLFDAYAYVVAPANRVGTVCLDSISEIAEVLLAKEKAASKDPRKAYGEMIDRMVEIIRAFRDIDGKHVYMTCKIESQKEEVTGAVKWSPSMPGAKLGQQMPYFFDEVFRLGIGRDNAGKPFRFLQTQPDYQFTAKDRSGSLDPYEPPHLGHIFQKIIGG